MLGVVENTNSILLLQLMTALVTKEEHPPFTASTLRGV
jgi:hypothetical protein